VPAERLLAFPGYADQVLWAPSPEEEHCGVGAARVLQGYGAGRFAQIRDGAARLYQGLMRLDPWNIGAPVPRLAGGFAFRATPIRSQLWQDFADARFLLPRIAYTRRAGCAWLTLSADAQELRGATGRARLIHEGQVALQLLHARPVVSPRITTGLNLSERPEREWAELVSKARGEITEGRFEKAVLARQVTLLGAGLPAPARVLERLRTEAPQCTRFALKVNGHTFLGASPERLIKCEDLQVWTEALAGSMRTDLAAQDDALLGNIKESHEHAIVARQIRATLTPLYQSMRADGPNVHRLRHLAHLRTRFAAVLKLRTHILDLVSQLHPTPAVGGSPRAAALEWINEHEQLDRGFYAGPFGVFDAAGNGEFVVAIRSGVLAATEAHLFAGAGIVEGSTAAAELAETRLKLRSLLAAFGVG
jgi:isochorismate synthase